MIAVLVVQVVLLPGCGPDVQKPVAMPTDAVLGHGVHARSWCVWCRLPDSAVTVEVPQLVFFDGRRLPFRAASPWSCLFGRPQRLRRCSVFWWSMPLLCRSCSLPVVVHDRCPRFRHADSRGGAAEAIPVIRSSCAAGAVLRCCRRPCDHAVTSCLANSEGASDSVHRRSWWTFQFATETGTLLQGIAVMMGFSAVLQHFSASVHLDVEAQGGGDARSLTPRRSVTPTRRIYWRVSTKTCVKSSVRTTTTPLHPTLPHHNTHHTTTSPPTHPPLPPPRLPPPSLLPSSPSPTTATITRAFFSGTLSRAL